MDISNTSPKAYAHLYPVPAQGVPSNGRPLVTREIELNLDGEPPTDVELEDTLATRLLGIPDADADVQTEVHSVGDPEADVEGDALLRTQVSTLRAHLDRLSKAEYAVITLRFGLLGDAWTVEETAWGLERSPASIRRIERRAITKLRILFGVEEDSNA